MKKNKKNIITFSIIFYLFSFSFAKSQNDSININLKDFNINYTLIKSINSGNKRKSVINVPFVKSKVPIYYVLDLDKNIECAVCFTNLFYDLELNKIEDIKNLLDLKFNEILINNNAYKNNWNRDLCYFKYKIY